MGHAGAQVGAARQRRQLPRGRRSPAVDARAAEHLSRRRRGAPARLRRGRGRLDQASPAAAAPSISRRSSNGGLVIGASDMHFGAKDNMIMPGRAENMGDGWETRRRRGPGFDWAIVRLGAPAALSKIEIDTNHFKGNYPESASLEGCLVPSRVDSRARSAAVDRDPAAHEAQTAPPASTSRRSWRRPVPSRTCGSTSFPTAASAVCASMDTWQAIDRAAPDEARRLLARACGSSRWVDRMLARRPFGSRDALLAAAATSGSRSAQDDWREAFAHHPKIGDREALRARFPATHTLSAREQAGVDGAPERRPRCARRGQSTVRSAVRLHLHRLRVGPERGRDAGDADRASG